jgi:hypothetical protein
MEQTETREMKIHYMDGKVQRFEFPVQAEPTKAGARLAEMMQMHEIALQLKDRLLLIPTHNVRLIEISPASSHLPPFVIRNAKMLNKSS